MRVASRAEGRVEASAAPATHRTQAVLGWVLGLGAAALALAAPHIFTGIAARHLLVLIAINIVLVASLDLLIGGAGLLSLGHAAFMGIGAYASALVVKSGQPFPVGLLAAVLAAALAGLIIGLPALRLKGHYFSVVTFIVGIIVTILMTNMVDLTRGPMGLTGIPFVKLEVFGLEHTFKTIVFKVGYYYFVLAFAALVLLLRWRVGRSRFGRALTAIKGDENLAESVGIATYRVKVTAFAVAAAVAGVAGSLYAHYAAFISPDSFTFVHSFDLFVMNLLGGAGTVLGPIVGPVFLTALTAGLKGLSPALAQVMHGVVLIVVIVVLPTGIAGGLKRLVAALEDRRR
ncbi:MAG: branched-chain amino acid ABC transporter permease [Trueperaceae bacterium]|nr:branched-chain amino acid ABC transporter permease [Trueperaceae bacterium]